MENDFFPISEDEQIELDRLGITYRWRDSCLPLKKDEMLCREQNKFTAWYKCKEQVTQWQQCELERERTIVKIPNFNLPPMEKRKI